MIMNVYYSNINKINENIEDFLIAKNKIELDLIDQEKIDKKMSVSDFLNYIDLQKTVFVFNEDNLKVIPFYIYNLKNKDIVILYSGEIEESEEEQFKEKLYNLNFSLDSLRKVDALDMLAENQYEKYFIINNEFYI